MELHFKYLDKVRQCDDSIEKEKMVSLTYFRYSSLKSLHCHQICLKLVENCVLAFTGKLVDS